MERLLKEAVWWNALVLFDTNYVITNAILKASKTHTFRFTRLTAPSVVVIVKHWKRKTILHTEL